MKAAETLRYHRRIFIAPFWPDIFGQDAERRQSADEAKRTCEAMKKIYTELGYDLVPLPLCSVEERMRFILCETSA
jgi:predicted ATPase